MCLAHINRGLGELCHWLHHLESDWETAMIYKIHTKDGIKEVEGEPVAIPGFEEYQFFVHHISYMNNIGEDYLVSEVTSGRCFRDSLAETVQESVSLATDIITTYGKEKFAKRLAKMKKINEVKR
jgi:hypothetical protein